MTDPRTADDSPVVVIGANGLVGARVCAELLLHGATVRAVVRRPGTAPAGDGLAEVVGDFTDAGFAASVLAGAAAVVTTVHPMGSDAQVQREIGVEGNGLVAREAARAGVGRLVHVSTGAVYDRSPGIGDVDESSALVDDDANDYAVTKRDTDLSLMTVEGITGVLLRPPAILGPGDTSVWNTLRPQGIREGGRARHASAQQSFPWVHVDDLAAFAAVLATVAPGPTAGGWTPVNVVTGTATFREYHEPVCRALGVDPVWDDGPAWTGQLLADRARAWGFDPRVDLAEAMTEIATGLRDEGRT